MLDVRPIDARSTRPLRQSVLRPHQTLEEVGFDGDEHPETVHFGAFFEGTLVGIASLYRRPPPGKMDDGAWQVRGMATAREARGKGAGRMLLLRCLEHARARGGKRVWCNARSSAVGFYERLGFRKVSAEFELPQIGPHFRMEIAL